jgi:hypothetical protein
MLLLNKLKNIINAFGIIDRVIEEGWLRIPRPQANEKLVRTLSDDGNSDQLREIKLLQTTSSLDLVSIGTLSIRQLVTTTTMMNVNPFMAIVLANVLHIQLPKYHDNDDLVIHI